MALIASFGLASAAVIATVNVQQSTKRDHASKEAIAAADAGANIAMLRLNRFAKDLASYKCVSPSGVAQTATASGWCPNWVEETTGGATYKYAVSAYGGTGVQVVSVGTADNVTRRVDVSLLLNPEKGVFEGESLIGEEVIHLKGASGTIDANIGTNGSVENSGSSLPTICAPQTERVGPGEESVEPKCGEVVEGIKKLPPVTPPADIATNNSNCRLVGKCANAKEVDTWGVERGKTGGLSFNSSTRELTLSNNWGTLTMGGKNYWLCKLKLSSGRIYIPAGVPPAEVRIYIDTPEHCGYPPGEAQIELGGGTSITSSGYKESGVLPAIYMLGDGSLSMQGSPESFEVMLYAPLGNVEQGGGVTWRGTIAAREININGKVTFLSYEPSKSQQPHYEPLLSRSRYVECGGGALVPGTEPNADC